MQTRRKRGRENLVNEENGSNTLAMTYVHDPVKPIGTVLADLAGSNPATGTARYYSQDNIGSTRRLRDASKANLGQYEYEPYGADYSTSGVSVADDCNAYPAYRICKYANSCLLGRAAGNQKVRKKVLIVVCP